jgi:hypothetical protein
MRVALGSHRMDETHFVYEFRQMWQQIGNVCAVLPAWLKLEGAVDQVAILARNVMRLPLLGIGCS